MARAGITQLAVIGAILALVGCDAGPSGALDAGEAACRNPGGSQVAAVLASNGADFLVVWANQGANGEPSSSAATHVSADGSVTDGCFVIDALRGEPQPAVAAGGDDYWIVWVRADPLIVRLSLDGQVTYPVRLSRSGGDAPALAFNGSDFLAVWASYRAGARVRGTRVRPPTEVLDPDSLPLARAVSGWFFPAVASDGTQFLAVWSRADDIGSTPELAGALVAADGTVLNPADIVIHSQPEGFAWPAIASSGTGYVVAWAQRGGVHASLLAAAGDVTRSNLQVAPAGSLVYPAGLLHQVAIASDGNGYLVVWSGYLPDDTTASIYGARISPDGEVLDPDGIPLSAGAAVDPLAPSVAWNGDTYLVAWQQSNGADDDIVATRVSAAGEVLDPDGILIAGGPPEPDGGGCSAGGSRGAGLPLAALAMLLRARRRVSRRSRAG